MSNPVIRQQLQAHQEANETELQRDEERRAFADVQVVEVERLIRLQEDCLVRTSALLDQHGVAERKTVDYRQAQRMDVLTSNRIPLGIISEPGEDDVHGFLEVELSKNHGFEDGYRRITAPIFKGIIKFPTKRLLVLTDGGPVIDFSVRLYGDDEVLISDQKSTYPQENVDALQTYRDTIATNPDASVAMCRYFETHSEPDFANVVTQMDGLLTAGEAAS